MEIRCTTLEFLTYCSPQVRDIHAYWERLRADRPVPLRRDLDPADIVPFLPGIVLVDVKTEPLDFVYRLVGTREVEARGTDPTGKRVAEAFFGGDAAGVLANYRHVATAGSPLYHREPFICPGGRYIIDETLFLPLTFGSGRVDQIMTYTHYQDLWDARPMRPVGG